MLFSVLTYHAGLPPTHFKSVWLELLNTSVTHRFSFLELTLYLLTQPGFCSVTGYLKPHSELCKEILHLVSSKKLA